MELLLWALKHLNPVHILKKPSSSSSWSLLQGRFWGRWAEQVAGGRQSPPPVLRSPVHCFPSLIFPLASCIAASNTYNAEERSFNPQLQVFLRLSQCHLWCPQQHGALVGVPCAEPFGQTEHRFVRLRVWLDLSLPLC